MPYIPALDVYKNKQSAIFTLCHEAVHPKLGCGTAWGPLTVLSNDEMRDRGLGIVQQSMSDAKVRIKSSPAEIETMPKDVLAKFRKDNAYVMISLQAEGTELWLAPMRTSRTGRSEGIGHREVFKLPGEAAAFFMALERAFARCD